MKLRKLTIALLVILALTTTVGARTSIQFDDMGLFTGPATFSRYDDLDDLVTTIGAILSVTVVINQQMDMGAGAVTVTPNITLDFKRQGAINITAPQTVTFTSPAQIIAPKDRTIFVGAGINDGVLFTNSGVVYPEWWGAVGDNNGTADNGTDDYTAIQAALDASRTVELSAKNYRVSTFLSITNAQQELFGQGASWSGYKTALIPDAALNTFVIVVAVTDGGADIHDFAIIGNESPNSLGGIHLEDDGASGNFANSVRNMHIRGFIKTGAYGIWVEAWGTNLYNLYIHSIRRGMALRFGAGGVTGTTQYFERVYVTESDIGMRFTGTNIGATGINCIFEANVVEILVEATSITLINPYFEHVNRVNNDGAGSRRSISVPTVFGVAVDAAISVLTNTPGTGSDARLTIQHMNLQSLDDAASTFIKVSDAATLIIEGGDWNDRITNPAQIVIGPGTTSILTIEDYKDLDISLFPQVKNKGFDRVWSSRRLQTTLLDSDEVNIASAATGTLLADFGVDIVTYYSFRVFGRIGDLVVSVNELYVTIINGTNYRIVVHESYNAGGYNNTFALANTGASKLDIIVTNDHGADAVDYQISLIHTALIK